MALSPSPLWGGVRGGGTNAEREPREYLVRSPAAGAHGQTWVVESAHQLVFVEPAVEAVRFDEIAVPALLDDPAALHHHDIVGLVHGGQAVRDGDRRAAFRQLFQSLAEQRLGFGVERAGGLVEQEHVGVAQDGPRDRQALLLAARQPGAVLVVDDVQWADASTRELLYFVVRRMRQLPLLLVMTYRREEVGKAQPLRAVLDGWRRAGLASTIRLTPLTGREVRRLVSARLGTDRVSRGLIDWLVKRTAGIPFAVEELLARLRALARRPKPALDVQLRFADLELVPAERVARRGDRVLSLTHREYALLEHLLRHPRRVQSRSRILEHVWDDNFDPVGNVVEVLIARLRRKVDAPGFAPLIHTVRGAGYVLTDTPAADVS